MSEKTYHIDWIRNNYTCHENFDTGSHTLTFCDDKRGVKYHGRANSLADAELDLLVDMQNAGYTIRYSTDLPDEPTSLPDPVNSPPHYKQGGIECITAIEAALTPEEYRGYCKGNAFKYIWRSNHKQNHDQDIQKAVWYLNRLEGIE